MKRSLSARHSFFGEHARRGACGPQSRVLLSRLVLGKVHRSCLRSEFVRGVAAERYRLAQVVYGQCPLVERPSRWWLFQRYHLNLAFTITVVAFTRPRCHRLRWSRSSLKIPRSLRARLLTRTSRRHVGSVHNSSRSGRAVCGAAGWSFSAGMPPRRWKRASPISGDHAIALRGVILANSVPHVEVHSRRPSRPLLGRS